MPRKKRKPKAVTVTKRYKDRKIQLISLMITVMGIMTAIKVGTQDSLAPGMILLFVFFIIFAFTYYIAVDRLELLIKRYPRGWKHFYNVTKIFTGALFAGFLAYFVGISQALSSQPEFAVPIMILYYILLTALFFIALS
ncbi:MAG: hypothetical protein KGH64_06085 [Candidatus Micrarchaeota archaeon]|nr:hypothetical protein [Candidatus Micrarchaeota archaeon]MDE1859205.1 hypothetical protein [Candidatus Micrarchaeota archaeon]